MKWTQFLAQMVANIIDRAFGSKPNVVMTIAGLVAALAAGLAAFPTETVPAKYQPYLLLVSGFLGALTGILGHGGKALPPDASKQ